MPRVLIIFALLLFLLQGPAQASDNLSEILEGVQKNYGHLPGLTITYTREVITRSMTMMGNQIKGDLATGQIYFRPPHFLKLEQETPKSETIIANGDTLWWYIPEKSRVHKYCSQKFGQELILLNNIFCGLAKVEESFQTAMIGRNDQGDHQIELKPDPPWEEIDHILLTVTSRYHIRTVDIHNQLGTITRFKLKGMRVKEKFEKGFFQFVVPEGVQLVEEGT